MKLLLFSSIAGKQEPNLVSIQHPALDFLPTSLVCPPKQDEPLTNVRVPLRWRNVPFTVLCDLARPVNRNALRLIREADEETSRRMWTRF